MEKQIKIVIADDHKMIRDAWKILLGQMPDILVVGEARNGLEVLSVCQQEKPDIVLMDINMPHMNGIEATAVLSERMPGVKIIALTINNEYSFIKKMIACGASGFVTKNASKEELFNAIQAIQRGEKYVSQDVSQVLLSASSDNFDKNFSEREIQVIQLVAQGFTTREIAQKMFLSEKTLEKHRTNIIKKSGLKNMTAVINYALQKGVIT